MGASGRWAASGALLGLGLGCAVAQPPARLPSADAGALTVRIIRPSGDATAAVAVALFDDRVAFEEGGEPLRKERLAAPSEILEWRLEDLPAGEYAVKAYLDLDGDGELGRGALGIPSEPYGVSNEARGRLGPPRWAAARFAHSAGGTLESIRLR